MNNGEYMQQYQEQEAQINHGEMVAALKLREEMLRTPEQDVYVELGTLALYFARESAQIQAGLKSETAQAEFVAAENVLRDTREAEINALFLSPAERATYQGSAVAKQRSEAYAVSNDAWTNYFGLQQRMHMQKELTRQHDDEHRRHANDASAKPDAEKSPSTVK